MKKVIIVGIVISAILHTVYSCCKPSQANKSVTANCKDTKCSHCGKTTCDRNCSAGTVKKDTVLSTQ
jgi:hypothetical protein